MVVRERERHDDTTNTNDAKDTLARRAFVRVFYPRERESMRSLIFRVSKKEVQFLSFLVGRSGEKPLHKT